MSSAEAKPTEDKTIVIEAPSTVEVRLPEMPEFRHTVEECLACIVPEQAVPRLWTSAATVGETLRLELPELAIDVLHRPYVFGGHITKRWLDRHLDGQLVLDSRKRIGRFSYGVMDGVASLPAGLCAEDDDRHFIGSTDGEVRMAGDFLFLGTAHVHFGHVLVEGLSRLWGASVLEGHGVTDPRHLVYESAVPDFAFELFRFAGIRRNTISSVPPVGRPDRLFVPTPATRTHHWIAPRQVEVWTAIARSAERRMYLFRGPRRVYLSRSFVEGRKLENEKQVEAIFAAKGFAIVHPHLIPVLHQVKIARDAEILAGSVGSQMYLAVFQAHAGDNIVLAPENFFLPDDALIAHVKGHRLSVFFGSLLDQGKWSVDLDRLKRYLDRRLFKARFSKALRLRPGPSH